MAITLRFAAFAAASAVAAVFFLNISSLAINFECEDERFELGTCMVKASLGDQAACQSCTYESIPSPVPEGCGEFQDVTCDLLLANCSDVCGWSTACFENYTRWLGCSVSDHPSSCPLACEAPALETAAPSLPFNMTTDTSTSSGVTAGGQGVRAAVVFQILAGAAGVALMGWATDI